MESLSHTQKCVLWTLFPFYDSKNISQLLWTACGASFLLRLRNPVLIAMRCDAIFISCWRSWFVSISMEASHKTLSSLSYSCQLGRWISSKIGLIFRPQSLVSLLSHSLGQLVDGRCHSCPHKTQRLNGWRQLRLFSRCLVKAQCSALSHSDGFRISLQWESIVNERMIHQGYYNFMSYVVK